MAGPAGSSCGACKFLRRRCSNECIFAPYFCYEQATNHFAAVHKVFGASNVSKLLLHLPQHCRSEAAVTMSYEALARMQDPIYGCVGHIFALEQQVASLVEEIEIFANQMAFYAGEVPMENTIDTLRFSLECNNMNVGNNHANHSITSLAHVNDTSANEAFITQMNAELPEINGFDNLFSSTFFDFDISDRVIEGPDLICPSNP
ncbi:PREDICTED: LOB domain-containing protein 33-like [Nicotiana attenuata]|uniref:Lob domain-containing protein 33 n=1 Tax=Nicotiana attenuata TaxID=49451 RepID=A0A314LFF3_NICAT|nr:PREDICTED: LOB domain-containing protein 33-like [Nicotiana attenuata]OIT39304.1 lob domain-containing protein 33 [Nicotiana attenuata]